MRKTKVNIPSTHLISYDFSYTFLGSCFSEHLSKKMERSGFRLESNPFGVLFNPISLSDLFLKSDLEIENSVFYRVDVSLSWLANSTVFAYKNEELKSELIKKRTAFLKSVNESKILFVTFGTAWIHVDKSKALTVANCHKMPQSNFEKRLLSTEEVVNDWSKVIEQLNAEVEIIFTVSPVRHSKDGLVENARSKAVLLNAVHDLNDKYSNVDYFPSYELMLDELRDYAYFQKDGVHPNEMAIDEIWKRFKETYFTEETAKISKEYDKIRMLFQHKSLHPESEKAKQFEVEREKKLEDFKRRFPSFNRGGR